MSFTVFRKYEKPLLIAACVFTVLVFAFFPSMGGLSDVFGGEADEMAATYGSFTVETTGETRNVTLAEFVAARNKLARLYRAGDQTDNDVWAHIIETADAQGAGVHVSDQELLDQLNLMTNGQIASQAEYRAIVRNIGFASLEAFEEFMREVVAKERWREVKLKAATVVPADDVYQRWRVDNELFDYEALVFADLDPEQIDDPGDDVLREHYDGLPEWQRNSAFVDPAKVDVAYGWLPLDALSEVPADVVATLDTPSDAEVDLRFGQLKATRFADMDELDADTRELLRDELRVIALVKRTHQELAALKALGEPEPVEHDHDGDGVPDHETDEDHEDEADDETGADDVPAGPMLDTDIFLATLQANGLRTVDPEGLLDPDGLEALEGIGSVRLPNYLRNARADDLHYIDPFLVDTEAHIVFVQDKVDQRTLDFEEGRDQVLEHWRTAQVSKPASDFREALVEAARELPAVAEVIGPLEEQATLAADERIAAEEAAIDIGLEPLSEEAKQAIRDEELAAVQPAIDAAVAEHLHEAWDALAPATVSDDVELREFSGISKSYRNAPDEDEDPASIERFLKTNPSIFQQAVDGITQVLRHPGSSSSVVVRVTGRRFPEMSAMLADEEGLNTARRAQANTARFGFFTEVTPESIVASHGLSVAELPDDDEDAQGS